MWVLAAETEHSRLGGSHITSRHIRHHTSHKAVSSAERLRISASLPACGRIAATPTLAGGYCDEELIARLCVCGLPCWKEKRAKSGWRLFHPSQSNSKALAGYCRIEVQGKARHTTSLPLALKEEKGPFVHIPSREDWRLCYCTAVNPHFTSLTTDLEARCIIFASSKFRG